MPNIPEDKSKLIVDEIAALLQKHDVGGFVCAYGFGGNGAAVSAIQPSYSAIFVKDNKNYFEDNIDKVKVTIEMLTVLKYGMQSEALRFEELIKTMSKYYGLEVTADVKFTSQTNVVEQQAHSSLSTNEGNETKQ